MRSLLIVVFLLSFVWVDGIAQSDSKWESLESFSIEFDTRSASGSFSRLEGEVSFDTESPKESYFDIRIDPSSIETGIRKKNEHAVGEGWLDVEEYPAISFQSDELRYIEGGYEVVGVLSLHGVEEFVAIPFTYTENNNLLTLSGELIVERSDYGISGAFFGFVVGDEIVVSIRVSLSKG